jgi:hypothetical protein
MLGTGLVLAQPAKQAQKQLEGTWIATKAERDPGRRHGDNLRQRTKPGERRRTAFEAKRSLRSFGSNVMLVSVMHIFAASSSLSANGISEESQGWRSLLIALTSRMHCCKKSGATIPASPPTRSKPTSTGCGRRPPALPSWSPKRAVTSWCRNARPHGPKGVQLDYCSEIDLFLTLSYRRHDATVFLYAFDLIELNGDDLRRDPLEVRKTLASTAPACRGTAPFSAAFPVTRYRPDWLAGAGGFEPPHQNQNPLSDVWRSQLRAARN